jgi:hypothetical protein
MEQFRISRALGLSFSSLFRNLIPFTLLAAIIYAPAYIMTATASAEAGLLEYVNRLITYPIYLIVAGSALLSPMMTYRIVQELNGTRLPMLQSIRYGLRGVIPAAVLGGVNFGLQFLPAGGIIGTIVTCIWFVCAPAAVAEQLGPGAALSRSATLTAGRRWGIFGLVFLIGLIQVGVILVWLMPKLTGHGDFEEQLGTGLASGALVFMIMVSVFQLFTGIVQAVSYALLRQDKDGVTHDALARVFE